jgi:rapamycin-insensitive companion of mTOR
MNQCVSIGVLAKLCDSALTNSAFNALQMFVLDTLFHVFRLPVPKLGTDPFSRDTTPEANSAAAAAASGSGSTMELPSRTLLQRHNLLDNYLAALLIAFIDANLFAVLIELNQRMRNEEPDDSDEIKSLKKGVALRATVLIGELLHLSNTLLPTSHCAKLQVSRTHTHSLSLTLSMSVSMSVCP